MVQTKNQVQELFYLNKLLPGILHPWQIRYEQEGFRLHYINQNQADPVMKGNPSEIIQILHHLLANSFEALKEKQNTLCEDSLWIPSATLTLSEYAHKITIRIEDNGCGIPPSGFSRLFDYGHSTKGSGRGTGLNTVQKLVKHHQGQIYVRSIESSGCTFHLVFPSL